MPLTDWILLTEDSEPDAVLTQRALRKVESTPRVHREVHGQAALAHLERCLADGSSLPVLVLLDLHMPVMTGDEFLEKLRAHPDLCHLPVVVLTTSNNPAEVRRTYQRGANAYLVKPVRAARLTEMMSRLDRFWLDAVELPHV